MSKPTGSSETSHIIYPSRIAASKDDLSSEDRGAPNNSPSETDKRLWLGNLDPKVTEVQKYGTVHHFDFLFHRSGPNIGLPRGYAFVEFEDREAAIICMTALEGKKIGERHLAIRWANQDIKDYPDEQTKLKAKLPALSVGQNTDSLQPAISKERAINAIEAKLRAMEREKNHQTFNLTSGNKPTSSKGSSYSHYSGNRSTGGSYNQYTNNNSNNNSSYQTRQGNHRPSSHYQKPYERKPYTR